MKTITIIFCILLMAIVSCSPNFGNIKTKIISGTGDTLYTIESKSDAMVTYKDTKAGVEFTVDNKGKITVWEQIFGILVTKPDISIRP